MSRQVFLSYSKKDEAVADTIISKLEGSGIRCWIAPRDILPGMGWAEAIIKGIRECPVMIFVFSSISNNSQHVMRELDSALDENIKIIPFRIEDVQPSDSIKYYIKSANWLDAFPEPNESHFGLLLKTVQQHLVETGESDRQEMPVPAPVGVEQASPSGSAGPRSLGAELSSSSRELNEYEKGLQSVSDLLRRKQWRECMKKAGSLFEKAMKRIFQELSVSVEDKDILKTLTAVQRGIGKDKSSLETFDLAQLASMCKEEVVIVELQKKMTSNLHKTKKINWDQVLEWEEAARHPQEKGALDESDAMQMAYWLKVFLYDCELVGRARTIVPIPAEARSLAACPYCNDPIKGDWKFCPECGIALKVTCSACHRVLAPDFRICPYCETKVRRRGHVETDEAKRAQEEYRVLCIGTYLDGVINVRERRLLDSKRLELGLTEDQAEKIERQCAPANVVDYTRLVEGVLVDGIITDEEREFLQQKAKELNLDSWIAKQIEEATLAIQKETIGDLQ
jgi:RNA polymerase subunit RPABC4/transcription elongation factor Spt4